MYRGRAFRVRMSSVTDSVEEPKLRITLRELRQYDGRDGRPCYTAYGGKIYDVTGSRLWRSGRHAGRHNSGEDLTDIMVNAPHMASVLQRFPLIGEIVAEPLRSRYVEALKNLHPHPMVVHFSEVLPILAAFFLFVFHLTHGGEFETAAYYMISLGLLSSFACMTTGFFSWSVTYERTMTTIFSRKIMLSVILSAIVTVLFIWRTIDPDIITEYSNFTLVYAFLIYAAVPVVVILGHYGGKIVYG